MRCKTFDYYHSLVGGLAKDHTFYIFFLHPSLTQVLIYMEPNTSGG